MAGAVSQAYPTLRRTAGNSFHPVFSSPALALARDVGQSLRDGPTQTPSRVRKCRAADRAADHVILAAYLGWTLDAFDFFIMAFVLREVAATFGVAIGSVAFAITLTLACRAIGAFAFGRLSDHLGRRPTLMVNVLCYSLLEFFSGLAPTLWIFLILRSFYGIAMGGEWGIGASLMMESILAKWRGAVSGLLQAGYPSGYLLASVLYLALPWLGWRGMFMVGVVPALLVFYIRRTVPESPDWLARTEAGRRVRIWTVLRQHSGLVIFAASATARRTFIRASSSAPSTSCSRMKSR